MQPHDISLEKNPIKGILICLVSYFFISSIGLCEKAISHNVSVSAILFFQNLTCLLLIIPDLLRSDIKTLKTNYIAGHALRFFSGLCCYATLFYIIRFIPISQALLYQYSASLWVPFIMLFWLQVSMPKKQWYGIILGFVGILFILKPGSLYGYISLIGILCGLLQALSMVAIRKLSVVEPTLRILFYYFLSGTVLSSVLFFENSCHIERKDMIFLIGVGVSTYLAQKLLTQSLKYANPTTLGPICYTSILFSGIFGWFFWGEIPTHWAMIGMILVVGGCLLTILLSQGKPASDEITTKTVLSAPSLQAE